MAANSLSAERLREILDYNSTTGVFVWKERTSNRVHLGDTAGCTSGSHGYPVIGIGGTTYLAHRLAWLFVYGKWPDKHIDHLNGNRADTRIANLRDVPNAINRQNMRCAKPENRCGLLGVKFDDRTGRWVARITRGGKQFHIGVFDTPEQAHDAYLREKRRIHEGCTI